MLYSISNVGVCLSFFRFFFLALITQPFYMLLFDTIELNILFSFSLFVLFMYFFEDENVDNRLLYPFACSLFFLLDSTYGFDYGLYGFLVLFSFYLFEFRDEFSGMLCFTSVTLMSIEQFGAIQLFSILSLFLLQDFRGFDIRTLDIKLNRYLYYLFYPAHLIALRGIGYALSL